MTKGDRRARIYGLRHQLIGDSRARERAVRELERLIRDDERDKTLTTLAATRPTEEDHA